MKLLLSILIAILPNLADAMCVNKVKNLVLVKVLRCQATLIASDNREESPHISNAEISGILISGPIIESNYVVAEPKSSRYLRRYGKPFDLPVGSQVTLFLQGDAAEQCPKLDPQLTQWFVTKDKCLDVIPFGGLGLIPYSIPVVELEPHPEKWHAYSVSEKDGS